MTDPKNRPKGQSSLAEQEMDKAEKQFEAFDNQVKDLTLDRMNMAPKQDLEHQTKLSQSEIAKSKDIYLKPIKVISCKDKFNEDFRKDYEFAKEYVNFTAENKEIIGESIDMWTRPFAGMPAEEWIVPTNKPVWAPIYVAEQIKNCKYHRLSMQQNNVTSADGMGNYYGTLVVDTTIQRLDAIPASTRRSVFMGASSFK